MRWWTRMALALALGSWIAGCGSVCEDAEEVCGLDDTNLTTEDCADATECAAICIVDWDACDVNNPEAPEAKCIAACLAQPEDA